MMISGKVYDGFAVPSELSCLFQSVFSGSLCLGTSIKRKSLMSCR